jgi:hypothetical protein
LEIVLQVGGGAVFPCDKGLEIPDGLDVAVLDRGLFMKYEEAASSGPPLPRSLAILAARTASMMTPAELGESQTSSLASALSGTSPNERPSTRM